MNELARFRTEESSSGRTLPFESFSFSLPGPGQQSIPNKPLLAKQARNDELGLAQQKVAEELLDGEELKEFVKKRIDEEKEVFQHGARFLKGAQGAILHTEAGLARMSGNKEEADNIARYLADPTRGARLTHLQQMADKQGLGPELKEELDLGFTGDLAEGAGQLTTQVTSVGIASAINPKLGLTTLVGQVVGANYEGNYQRSKQERIEKELDKIENPEMLGTEGYQALLDRVDGQANEDARNNLWTAIPEIALDRIFLGGAGKLLKGSAGTAKDKVTTFTLGSLAEGASEATSAFLQNYMVQRNINPDQEVGEGVLRDFALGLTLGTGVNLVASVGGVQGSGEANLRSEIAKLQKDIQKDLVVKAKELAKEGDPQAIKFLSDYKNVREQQIVNDNTDTLKSVSVGVGTDKGMSVQQVKDALGKKGDQISSNLPIHVVDTMDNIGKVDENLQGKFSKDDQIEGLYVGANGDKKVILVADQLNNADDVTRVLRHESIGHFGTEMVTGSMQEFFYSRVASDYINTELGQRIMRDYANDPNFNEIVLGKEIVARVSENPNMAPLGLKQSLIDSFHKVTGNKIEQSPETDRQILKSITLADQLVTTPLLKRMDGPITTAKVDAQDEVETYLSNADQRFTREDVLFKKTAKETKRALKTTGKQKELKAGITRDKNGNLFYKGKEPMEWSPEDFTEVGEIYGIKNFGGLSPLVDIKDPETGKTYQIPGGLNGKFSYYDMLWIKSNQPGINNIGEQTHAKITKKLAESLTPEKVDKVEQFNRLAFGFLSPNAPLLPNEFGVARIFSQSMDDIRQLAEMSKTYPADANTEGMDKDQAKEARAKVSKKRAEWNKTVKKAFDIGAKGKQGGIGIGLTQDFSRLANFARLYVKDPDFFIKKADESWSDYVDKVSTQVAGFGTKTATFGGVWQDPYNAMISAIDRHMAKAFTKDLLKDKELKKRFSSTVVTAFNKELGKARKARTEYRKKLKKATTDKQKQKVEKAWVEKQETIIDPSMREVKTLDGVMAQVNRGDADKGTNALAKAVFATMTSDKPKYKTKRGVNPNVREEARLLEFIEEPKNFDIMSEAYRKALEVNERKAEELGIPVFPAQWTLWDRIRQRIEPHEVMFPGLHKLPRMGRDQIARSFNASTKAGYAVAPQPIVPTGADPASLVYFSKKASPPDPITGESKFGVRLQYDDTLPKRFRENLDILYQVQTHQEVLDSLRPWLRARKNKNYEQMASEIVNMDNPDLTPEQKILLGQILIKRLGVESEALQAKMLDKKKAGQTEFDFGSSSIDLNRKDKLALDLSDSLMEYGRTLGRGVSIFQAFSALTPRGRIRFAKRQMQRVVKAKVEAKSPDMERVVSALDDIIRIAQQAGFDGLSLEFLRKRTPNLIKLIEEKYPPSLWGAYRKESVNKLHSAIMAKYNETGEQAGPTKTPLARFVNELVSEIKSRTDLNPQAKAGEERSVSQVLRDALLNSEKYAEVWHEFAKRTMSDKSLTDEQRAELQDFFGEIPSDPSQKIVRATIKERMEKLDMKFQQIARQGLSNREGQASTLVPALMKELDLPRDIANKLASRMKSEFNLMVKEEANKQLDRFKKKDLMPKIERATKGSEQFIIEMANLGAFDRSDLYDALGKRLGVKGFDRAFAQQIKKVADEIEKTPEGFQRNDKITDLMNLIQNQAGDGKLALLMAIRTANLVSGVSTQLVNLTGNLSTAVPMAGTHLIRSGFDPNIGYRLAVNMLHGFGKGMDEAKSVMMTGRGRAGYEMTKYSFDPILERKTLPGGNLNPFNYLKFVHRFMSAMDMAFRFANTEGKATLLAGLEANRMGLKGKAKRDYIQQALKLDANNVETAVALASAEGLSGLNHRRRVNEILENRRDPDLKEESEQYGLRTTYQNVPEGALGVVASAIARFNYPSEIPGQYVPPMKEMMAGVGQFFIPFIRVVANVQNMMFDFTPGVGLARAALHKRGYNVVRSKGKPASDEMIKDMASRQLIGTALAGVLGYLFFSEEEDEENRLFDVTAGGPKNYQKKKTLIEAGYKPYTVTMFGVDIGYKETPFGGFLAYMGGIKDQKKYEDEPLDFGSSSLAGTMAYGRLMYDQAFFKGVADFIDIAKSDEASASALKRLVQSGSQSFVVPNLFNQIDNALSNRRYDTGQMDSLLSHYFLPLVPFAKNLGMPNLTVFGEPVERHTEGFINGLFDRVVRAQKTDPLLEKLVNKGIIPVKPNAGQLIRGEEEDEALSVRHREQDLYLFNEIKGRHYRRMLESYDKSGKDDGVESRLNNLSKLATEAVNKKLISASATIARARVKAMDRDEVERRLRMIKRKFDGPLKK